MKKVVHILIISVLTMCCSFAQCNTYYNFKEGSKWELDTYNKKGNKTGTVKYFIKDYTALNNGYKAIMNMIITNKNGKQIRNGNFAAKCENGMTYFDMEQFIPEESLKAFGNMKLTVTGEELLWPATLSTGMRLKDGHIEVKGDQGFLFNLKMDIVDRKVVGKEKITTPLGAFDCYKITYKMKMKTIVSIELGVTQWIAEGIGTVKAENFNKNGKMIAYSMISKYEM